MTKKNINIIKGFIFCSLLLIFGCNSYGEMRNSEYLNMDSLLSANTEILKNAKVKIEKIGSVNDLIETKVIEPNSETFKSEFEIFRLININKPGSVNAYEITIRDATKEYTLKKSESQNGVLYQKLSYSDGKKLTKIESIFKESNSLYQSERTYYIHLNEDELISGYNLIGRQKVLFGEWTKYKVIAKIEKAE